MYKKRLTLDWPFNFNEALTTFAQDARELVEDRMSAISVNISEEEKFYKIYVLAPGWEKKDFKIGIENNILSISAEAKLRDENVTWLKKEWGIGAFTRKFTVKDNVDTKSISAKYENGILEISLAKTEQKAIKSEITVH